MINNQKIVPRIPIPSREEFLQKILPAQLPVIFTEYKSYLLADPLTLLDKIVGKKEIYYYQPTEGHSDFVFGHDDLENPDRRTLIRSSLAEFIFLLRNQVCGDPARSTTFIPIQSRLPRLSPFFISSFFPDVHAYLQLGYGQKSCLHFDSLDNLATLLYGEKEFLLIPPSHLHRLHFDMSNKSQYGVPQSRVNPWSPDHQRYPEFIEAEADLQIARLRAGDILYLPSIWSHAVKSTGVNVMITQWWDSGQKLILGKEADAVRISARSIF